MSWRKTRLKFLSDEPIANGLGESGEFDDPAWPRYVRTTDIAGSTSLRDDTFVSLPPEVARKAPLIPGDIVMTAAGATIGKSFRYEDPSPACYAGYLVRFRARPGVDCRFISYWMESTQYWDQIKEGRVVSTIENFSASKYQNLQLRIPETDEQWAIADYLDAETARIDALIAKKRRMIELMEERFAAWRDRLMVEAQGVVWTPLHRLTDPNRPIVYGIVQAGEEVPDGIPYIKTGDVERLIPKRLSRTSAAVDQVYRRARVHPGDIVIAMRASIGLPVIVPPDLPVANLTQGTARIAPREGVNEKWLFQVLRCGAVQAQCELRAVGSTFKTLNIWDLRRLSLPTPSFATQAEIAKVVDEREGRLTNLVDAIQEQVSRLRERRKALITSAVTGELNIREAP